MSRKNRPLRGKVTVPGDKSISHRAVIMASMAIGQSRISGLLEGQDVLGTVRAMTAMGADIYRAENGDWLIHGVGVGGLCQPEDALDMGNSGTGARLIMGLVSTYPLEITFVGDPSLSCRPMRRVTEPLKKFGAGFHGAEGMRLPLTVSGIIDPAPMEYELPVASAQVKSAILLAALNTPGRTTVIEKIPTRDHTERLFRYFGVPIEISPREGATAITVTGHPDLVAQNMIIPGDTSSAAFLVVAALITPGSDITVKNVNLNPTRTGLYQTLRDMGADISFINERLECGEPVADIGVKYSPLKGVTVPESRAASMIDEYPVLAVAASFAGGDTIMGGIGELRVKESDRIAVMVAGLEACGVTIREYDDGMTVTGSMNIAGGVRIKTHLDHRIAMSFLVLGMATDKPVEIDDASVIDTSFPAFAVLMNGLGANMEEISQ